MKESNKQETRREFGKKVLTLAVGGMFAGAALTGRKVFAADEAPKDEVHVCKGKAKDGKNDCASAKAKHECKGKNDCKGLGGCGATAGKNDCKGKGECKVPVKGHDAKKE